MISTKDVKKEARKILKNEFNGITYNDWCIKVQNSLKEVDIARIKSAIKEVIQTYWKVEHIIKSDEKIYIYHDLIK